LWLFQQTTFYHQLEAQHLDASSPKMGLQAEYPICLICAPLMGYDEPEILPSRKPLNGLKGDDGRHADYSRQQALITRQATLCVGAKLACGTELLIG
jgi:hypothetical protein